MLKGIGNRRMTKKKPLIEAEFIQPDIKEEKIIELLEMLNKPASRGRFWRENQPSDNDRMGHILGVVPVVRIVTSTIGSHYFPYEKKDDQTIAQFIVIDVLNKEIIKSEKLNNTKSNILNNYGIKHIISDDINYIYDVVQNIS